MKTTYTLDENDENNYKYYEASIKCLHDSCSKCNGRGIEKNTGKICIHMISCPCVKCNPHFMKNEK